MVCAVLIDITDRRNLAETLQNIFLTRDIINFCNQKHMNGYILTIYQEKAFARADRVFLMKVMKKMNIGDNMLSWIEAIYHETQSSTQINGYESVRFPLTRGVRQCCSMSAILYSMLAETLGEEIRKSEKLFGIVLTGNEEIKITQYADDTTIFLSEKTQLKHPFDILKRFEKATGSVNEAKTKGIKLGPSKHQDECHHKIKWKNGKGIKILGIKLFPDNLETTNKNWSKRMAELWDFIEKNQTRKLSLRGRILLPKAMAKFWYLATVIPMPKWFLKPTEKLLFEFFWSGSQGPYQTRNDIFTKQRALRLRFLQHIVNPLCTTKWVILARYWIGFQFANVSPQWNFYVQTIYQNLTNIYFPIIMATFSSLLKFLT